MVRPRRRTPWLGDAGGDEEQRSTRGSRLAVGGAAAPPYRLGSSASAHGTSVLLTKLSRKIISKASFCLWMSTIPNPP